MPASKKISLFALQEPEFRRELGEAAKEIREHARTAASEATIEGHFERVLYASLRGIGFLFNPEKQVLVNTRRHLKRRGRMDSRMGALVIEYKRPATFHTERQVSSAGDQLEDYMEALSEAESFPVHGFLTDGRTYCELFPQEGKIYRGPRQRLDDVALHRLASKLVSLDLAALTSDNLIRDLCGNGFSGILFHAARELNSVLRESSSPKTQMLKSEWEQLFRVAHDEPSQQRRIQERQATLSEVFKERLNSPAKEYTALFSLHTAYALVLKLIAYRIVCELRLGSVHRSYGAQLNASDRVLGAFCAELEGGEVFREIGILNLLEGDFFSWYADSSQWTKGIAESVRKMLRILAQYEQAKGIFEVSGAVDLFRELYEATVPQVVRASFGEFYTPSWLAAQVLESARPSVRVPQILTA